MVGTRPAPVRHPLWLTSPPQAASPACTELETVMLDWLGKMLRLPDAFLAGNAGMGGGVIQVRTARTTGLGTIWGAVTC